MPTDARGPILHFPDDHCWHGRGLIVTVPACRPLKGQRRRDSDERNCHGDTAAVTCKRCLQSARYVAAVIRRE